MNMQIKEIEKKITTLKKRLKPYKRVLVAFSGGKDSFFLVKTAVETLGKENVLALFIKTGFSTKNDRKRVDYFTKKLDFQWEQMDLDIASEGEIMSNPKNRCYFCKKKIFAAIKTKAKTNGIDAVLDGTTYSDLDQYRPGLKALEELHILSPLLEAQISSGEIVFYLKEKMGIEDYYLSSSTCLATRFPYDMELDETLLKIFDEIETYFVTLDIYPVKIRYIPEGIRIETPPQHFPSILKYREQIIRFCKEKGLKFVTLDLEGIKSGVWD